MANNVGQIFISFAFNLGQFDALIVGQVVFDCEPLHIMRENGYSFSKHASMNDYSLVEKTHYLSEFIVISPEWQGENIFQPWKSFKDGKSPTWYEAYNQAKHNRHKDFHQANLKNLIYSIAGLVTLLHAQFGKYEYPSIDLTFLVTESSEEDSIGSYFQVRHPRYREEDTYFFESDDCSRIELSSFSYIKPKKENQQQKKQ